MSSVALFALCWLQRAGKGREADKPHHIERRSSWKQTLSSDPDHFESELCLFLWRVLHTNSQLLTRCFLGGVLKCSWQPSRTQSIKQSAKRSIDHSIYAAEAQMNGNKQCYLQSGMNLCEKLKGARCGARGLSPLKLCANSDDIFRKSWCSFIEHRESEREREMCLITKRLQTLGRRQYRWCWGWNIFHFPSS